MVVLKPFKNFSYQNVLCQYKILSPDYKVKIVQKLTKYESRNCYCDCHPAHIHDPWAHTAHPNIHNCYLTIYT